MRKEVEKKIKLELDQLETVNIGLDGWSDKIQRCFNGYIAQGINWYNWYDRRLRSYLVLCQKKWWT